MIKHLTDIICKMSTIPFTEEMFFERDYFEELLNIPGHMIYKQYEELKDTIQKNIRGRFAVSNLDTLKLLFEQYFPVQAFQKKKNVSDIYLEHLANISKSFICHRNGRISFKYWSNENDSKMFGAFDNLKKVELWNTFSRFFCIDILVIIYLINNNMAEDFYLNGYYWLINLGDIQIEQILECGVAENHIHINAGLNFNFIWEDFMNLTKDNFDKMALFNQPGKEKYLGLIRMCAIVRLAMADYLYFSQGMEKTFFEDYMDEKGKLIPGYRLVMDSFIRGNTISNEDVSIKKIYEKMTESFKSIQQLFDVDLDTTDENLLLFRAIKYITANEDYTFSKIFWQYIKFKNIIYTNITQNNFLEGLNYFVEFYSRASQTRLGFQKQLELAIKNQIYNNNLAKLEIRLVPSLKQKAPQIKKDVVDTLKVFFETYKAILESDLSYDKIPQIGIVFHMLKKLDDAFFEKCWYIDVNGKDVQRNNYFYGKLQKTYIETINVINELREKIAYLSNYIVGIDAASIENNTEPWVFAPAYKIARDSKTHRIKVDGNSSEVIRNLGFTYHVGEDYRHLLSGLRHIDEVIEHFGYHAGDRIGHGIALGIDTEAWCRDHSITIMPRIEYLENMLWLWGLCYNNQIDTSYFNEMYVERAIMEEAQRIYINIDGINSYNLWRAYQKKFEIFEPNSEYINEICLDPEMGRGNIKTSQQKNGSALFCSRQPSPVNIYWNEDKLLHAYHCKCYLERMYEIKQIKVEERDIKLLNHLQSVMRKKINRKGIVIETNPTSNLAISGIQSLFNHHVTNLNVSGLEQTKDFDKGLIISINSDDPAVFNTSISNELSYIFYLLQEKGYSRDSILQWIEKIRNWGVQTSFIHTRKVSKEKVLEEIKFIMEALR